MLPVSGIPTTVVLVIILLTGLTFMYCHCRRRLAEKRRASARALELQGTFPQGMGMRVGLETAAMNIDGQQPRVTAAGADLTGIPLFVPSSHLEVAPPIPSAAPPMSSSSPLSSLPMSPTVNTVVTGAIPFSELRFSSHPRPGVVTTFSNEVKGDEQEEGSSGRQDHVGSNLAWTPKPFVPPATRPSQTSGQEIEAGPGTSPSILRHARSTSSFYEASLESSTCSTGSPVTNMSDSGIVKRERHPQDRSDSYSITLPPYSSPTVAVTVTPLTCSDIDPNMMPPSPPNHPHELISTSMEDYQHVHQ